MSNKIDINYENLKSYIQISETPLDVIRTKVNKIDKILTGEIQPTFNQLSTIARIINIPTGLLILDKKINTTDVRINFRTFDSNTISVMSPELRDTISEIQTKQDFLRGEIDDELDFIGSFSIKSSEKDILDAVRSLLGEELVKNRLSSYREKMNNLGVFVFFNGKVKDNTHRNLNLKEFRGFVLTDKKAPVIFINQKDTKTGQLFTIIHEFVHLLFGHNDLVENSNSYFKDPLEIFVNKITGEFLVPADSLKSSLIETFDYEKQLNRISNQFEVSPFVIARRLLDLKYISNIAYNEIMEKLEVEFEEILKNKKTSSGNYNYNLKFRMDKSFFKYVNNAVVQNKISQTDAMEIVGVKYKGYKILVEGIK